MNSTRTFEWNPKTTHKSRPTKFNLKTAVHLPQKGAKGAETVIPMAVHRRGFVSPDR
jgi:hypothetical protein